MAPWNEMNPAGFYGTRFVTKYTYFVSMDALMGLILFTEVSIANRPFEHILWPEVFNFR